MKISRNKGFKLKYKKIELNIRTLYNQTTTTGTICALLVTHSELKGIPLKKTYICYLFSFRFGFFVGILVFRSSFRGKHSHNSFRLVGNLFGSRWAMTIGGQLTIGLYLTWYLKIWLVKFFRRWGFSRSSRNCSCTLYGTKPETECYINVNFEPYFQTLASSM